MNNIIPPINRSTPMTQVKKRSEEAREVESHSDERQHRSPEYPSAYKYDRRKNPDRRKQRRTQAGLYEFRSGRGRRRSDKAGLHVRIDV